MLKQGIYCIYMLGAETKAKYEGLLQQHLSQCILSQGKLKNTSSLFLTVVLATKCLRQNNIWKIFFFQKKSTWKKCFCSYMCTADHILSIHPEMFYLSRIYAHVGQRRRALSVTVDVVIIRHGARQEGGVHCSLCAACPMTE